MVKKKGKSVAFKRLHKKVNEMFEIFFELEYLLEDDINKISEKEYNIIRSELTELCNNIVDLADLSGYVESYES